MTISADPGVPTLPTADDVHAAAKRLRGVAHRTPVMTSRTLDERLGATVFFKCENLQRAGAFKFRGAYNAVSLLSDEERARGVLAYSSGNHAQAVALTGRLLGVRTTIVMPDDAPTSKVEGTRGYGAEVILYDKETQSREALAAQLKQERGMSLIPPYDYADVVAGQGTAALELLEETGPLDALLAPCGGGGLLSGTALVAGTMSPGCRVIGVEPELADDATRSFRTGTVQTVHNPPDHRRRPAHAGAGPHHLSAGPHARRRHAHRQRAGDRGCHALSVDADEDRRRALRRRPPRRAAGRPRRRSAGCASASSSAAATWTSPTPASCSSKRDNTRRVRPEACAGVYPGARFHSPRRNARLSGLAERV